MSNCACSIPFCRVSEIPTIICYGPCQEKFHGICLGIPDSCIDLFRDPKYGFRYFCIKCREVSVTSIHHEFKMMEASFNVLRGKFLTLYENVSKKDSLDLDSSSKIESLGKRRVRDMDEITLPIKKKTSINSTLAIDKEVVKVSGFVETPQPLPVIDTTSLPVAIDAANPPMPADILSAIPRPVAIFVSRLDPKTTVEQVREHIRMKIGGNSVINVKKLTKDNRVVSSFRLIVDPDLKDSVLQKEIWPVNAFVKMFDQKRSNKRVRKRHNNPSTSKGQNSLSSAVNSNNLAKN